MTQLEPHVLYLVVLDFNKHKILLCPVTIALNLSEAQTTRKEVF